MLQLLLGFLLPSSTALVPSDHIARKPYSRRPFHVAPPFARAALQTRLGASKHEVHWLDEEKSYQDPLILGEAIARGEVVLSIPDVADVDECDALFDAALDTCDERGIAIGGRSRFSVSDPTAFSNHVVLICEEMLLRVLDYIDERIPSIYETLFKSTDEWLLWQPLNAQLEKLSVPPSRHLNEVCRSLRELYMMGELEWSEGEPAINVYEAEGHFGAHKDHLALTVLIPLASPSEDFDGGGTGFWVGNRKVDENPEGPPTMVLKPPPGTALIFGGDVTHAGMAVEDGCRSVFVCSFSTRTPVSSKDRLHGMQAPPVVSPNFKGTA
mmetsp:Transcript_49075/g.59437  ORF Transcript_49075/g.59437 Transcript_49075/m.59437 type:complete len:326 (+) Transcript_49075:53-1030(+)|eukprot:CAMPEP_0172504924 /NCGR_PEP_ID=MMETSP1066-20121228/182226_1 /TAXON_ID=671091 /ORGANISM="Coscinodiscus wailesii, Strain CCMP2513" /LENGTH=325 /DNA_ID=CAMNT_0013281321 /DNA_START=42 /DNA_END=1019 /DNA_ORIENTATION=+